MKQRKIKKGLAIAIALAILAPATGSAEFKTAKAANNAETIINATAEADNTTAENNTAEADSITAEDITAPTVGATSGTSGENLTWTLSDDFTLTISGTGSMVDYWLNEAPWNSSKEIITKVVIENGVTTIGDYAFYNCDSLVTVTIPDSVTTIGEDAFWGCSSLTSVTIPDSVTTIGDRAFYNCTSLTTVAIPDSVTTIGDRAFWDCTSLTSETIPDSVTTIGEGAFYGTVIYNDDSNWVDGVLYIDNCLIEAKSDILPSNYTIKDGTRLISDSAFRGCISLVTVAIPDSVTTIDARAFFDCDSLTSVTIPDSVTTIGNLAFCLCRSLTSVTISDSVTTISTSAFGYCFSLTTVAIPDSVTTIGDSAFYNCYSLTSVAIPDSVTTIVEDAFYNCSSLTTVAIPDSVTTIDYRAFGYYYDHDTGEYEKIENFTIYGEAGTAAEAYANENGFAFVEVSGVEFTNGQITVTNGVATGFTDKTTLADLKAMIAGSNYTVKDFNGNILSDDDKIGTGTVITAENGDVITIVVKGDTDGDGEINSTDYVQVKKAFLETINLEGVFESAADTDGDGIVGSTDYVQIKSKFLGKM